MEGLYIHALMMIFRSAAWGGHTEVVTSLLEGGAEVDHADSDQRTALRAAARCLPTGLPAKSAAPLSRPPRARYPVAALTRYPRS